MNAATITAISSLVVSITGLVALFVHVKSNTK